MKKICYLLPIVVIILACTPKDDIDITYESGTNPYINKWIYEQMERYYYWNYTLSKQSKTNLDLDPEAYFKSLLYTGDSYSSAYHPALGETFSQSMRKSFGCEMGLTTLGNQTFAVVLYSIPTSVAANIGLTRGVLIKTINGENITTTNFKTLYNALISLEEAILTITTYTEENGFTTPEDVVIHQSFTFNQPIREVILTTNTKKVGYLNLPYFEVGMAQDFIAIFENMKQQQVDEVVLDLRYNGGGDVSSATALSIILADKINADDLFITFEGNKNGGIIDQSFKDALETNESNVAFEDLRNAHPSITTLYVLCGERTASASEIIINNLRSYMNVVTIGETTYGKNYASFIIQDERDSENPGWILSPVIYALYNAEGEGDYQNGITPNYQINELDVPELFPLGNVKESLLKKVLELII